MGALAHAFDKMVRLLQARETEARQAEQRLRDSEARFRGLAENAQDLIFRYRLMPTHVFEYVSPSAAAITGYTPEEYYADPDLYLKIVHPDDRHLLGATSRSFGQPLVLRWRRKDGTLVWMEERNIPVYDAGGNLVALEGIARDVTERMQQQHSLAHEAFHDKLTDLANRAMFLEELGRTMRQVKEKPDGGYAVLFMDLDRFKTVNDTLGHEKGDQLLVAVARRLEGCLRAGDIVARLGGDEFTILLPNATGVAVAQQVSDRILKSIAAPFDVNGNAVRTTFSIGIAMCGARQYERPEDVLRLVLRTGTVPMRLPSRRRRGLQRTRRARLPFRRVGRGGGVPRRGAPVHDVRSVDRSVPWRRHVPDRGRSQSARRWAPRRPRSPAGSPGARIARWRTIPFSRWNG